VASPQSLRRALFALAARTGPHLIVTAVLEQPGDMVIDSTIIQGSNARDLWIELGEHAKGEPSA
jgi:hypothetical protein